MRMLVSRRVTINSRGRNCYAIIFIKVNCGVKTVQQDGLTLDVLEKGLKGKGRNMYLVHIDACVVGETRYTLPMKKLGSTNKQSFLD